MTLKIQQHFDVCGRFRFEIFPFYQVLEESDQLRRAKEQHTYFINEFILNLIDNCILYSALPLSRFHFNNLLFQTMLFVHVRISLRKH